MQIVGKTFDDLSVFRAAAAYEKEPTAQTTRDRAAQPDRNDGRRDDGLTTDERAELQPAAPREPHE